MAKIIIIKVLQILPFLQALTTGLCITGNLLYPKYFPNFNIFNISDIICFIGFGLVFIKKHLWGVYALILYCIGNLFIKSFMGVGSIGGSLLFVVVYLIGGIILYLSDHLSPKLTELNFKRIAQFGIILYIGSLIIGGIVGFLSAFIRLGDFGSQHIIILAISTLWMIVIFTFVPKQSTPWVFETLVLISITTQLLGLIDIFLGFIKPLLWFRNSVLIMACAIIGWALKGLLWKINKRRGPK